MMGVRREREEKKRRNEEKKSERKQRDERKGFQVGKRKEIGKEQDKRMKGGIERTLSTTIASSKPCRHWGNMRCDRNVYCISA